MASKDIKKHERNDIIGNRIMAVVLCAMAVILLLTFIDRGMNTISETSVSNRFIIEALVISIPAVLLAGALLYFFRTRKADYSMRTMSPGFLLSLAALLFVLGVAIRIFPLKAIDAAYFLIPILAVLYIVYYCYQRECFAFATMTACAGIALYCVYKVGNYVALRNLRLPLCILLAVLALGYLLMMARTMRGTDGMLKVGKRKLRLSDQNTALWVQIAGAVLAAAAFVAAGVNATWAYYGILVLVGYAVLAAIYFTVMLAKSERAGA